MGPIKIILNSNQQGSQPSGPIPSEFNQLIYSGMPLSVLSIKGELPTENLERFIEENSHRYIVGFLGYDIGYQMIMHQEPSKPTLANLPAAWLAAFDAHEVADHLPHFKPTSDIQPIQIKQVVNKDRYIKVVNDLKQHIQLGDIYEVNYCIPFVAENVEIDPFCIWEKLNEVSPMPFAAMIDHQDFCIISASPERFIKKKNDQLFIQPMKGTKPRGKTTEEDLAFYHELKNDPKERAENVMIVDLTRNDLSKLAKKGTVKVEELFGVYAFQSVHQMISTISCEIQPDLKLTEILQATYPMGSMTGAPKIRAMELIDQYEDFSRGSFSGMLGYINPEGSFDFNVMIRTIFYDKQQKKIFMAVGSAITAKSDVEKEYEECLIKLQPLLKALNATLV